MLKHALTIFAFTATAAIASKTLNEDKGNWTQTFKLMNGEEVIHTPNKVQMGWMTSGAQINIKTKNYNGMPMKECGLVIGVKMTKEEFVKALIASGIYKK